MPSRWIHPVRVLSVGMLPELVALRQAVLEGAGYEVFSTSKPEAAISIIENGDCGVLLLCYSINGEKRENLVMRFRERYPHGRTTRDDLR